MSTRSFEYLGRFAMFLVLAAAFAVPVQAQQSNTAALTNAQLEQLVAPIALHPDPLLSQMLMASTYPTEVVQAARWTRDNSKVSGQALQDAMQKQPWDASVKALTAVPQTLQMMSDKLDWTQQLRRCVSGAARQILWRQSSVLRQRAEAAGHLKTSEQQTVSKADGANGERRGVHDRHRAGEPRILVCPGLRSPNLLRRLALSGLRAILLVPCWLHAAAAYWPLQPPWPLVPPFGVISTGGEIASTSMSIASTSSIAPTSLTIPGVTILGIAATFPIAMPRSPSASAMRAALLPENHIGVKRRLAAATWRKQRRPNLVVERKPSLPPKQNLSLIRTKPGKASLPPRTQSNP